MMSKLCSCALALPKSVRASLHVSFEGVNTPSLPWQFAWFRIRFAFDVLTCLGCLKS